MKSIQVGKIPVGGSNPLVLIAGPCVVENRDMVLRTAGRIQTVTRKLRIPFIFKSSYKKANRTSARTFAGIDVDQALGILEDVKQEFGVPILTDIHSESEALPAAEVADIL